MSTFWSPLVAKLTPYTPGEQPRLSNLIKLNTNENPYGPSPQVLSALRAVANDALRLYPDPNASQLKAALASYHGVTAAEVFVGNGSDEVLALTFLALLKHDAPLLFPDITYSFYPVYCSLYEIESKQVPLTDAMTIDPSDYRQPCGGIIFPNPNAPTGISLATSAIETILTDHPDQVVVVDEAYIDFGGESVIPLVARYPNLLVVQTLSKSRSLAGLRVGFAIGQEHLIEALERIKNSFNSYPLDRLAQAGALAAYQDEAYFQQTRKAVIASREQLSDALTALGFQVLPSHSNFLFAQHPQHDAAQLAAQLRARAIIVRHFALPRISQYLRISIGNPEQCAALVAALTEILAA
ncbi:MAG: histidinol-phosphate transaminase [Herbaspirillum sp.]